MWTRRYIYYWYHQRYRVITRICYAVTAVLTCVFLLLRMMSFDYDRERPSDDILRTVFGPNISHSLDRSKEWDERGRDSIRSTIGLEYNGPDCTQFSSDLLETLDDHHFRGHYSFSSFQLDPLLHVYTYQKRPILWAYWDGKDPMPPYIKLGIMSWQCHNMPYTHVAVLNESLANQLIGPFPSHFRYLVPSHKSDFIRLGLLEKFGGQWLDSDLVGWDKAYRQFDYLHSYDVFGYQWEPDRDIIGTNIIGPMRLGNLLINTSVRAVNRLLAEKQQKIEVYKKDPFSWTEILGTTLIPLTGKLTKENKIRYFGAPGAWTYGQLVLRTRLSSLVQPTSADLSNLFAQLIPTPFLIYHNNLIDDDADIRKMSIKQFMHHNSTLAQIFRKSFQICQLERKGCVGHSLWKSLRL